MAVLVLVPTVVLPASLLGGVLAYRTGIRNLEAIIPVGGALGLVAYLLGLNLVAYAIPVQTGFWLVGPLLGLLAVALLVQQALTGEGSRRLHLDPKAGGIIGLTALLIGLFFGVIIFATPGYDTSFHWALISTISQGNFPVRLPQTPDFYVQYHYAYDLLAAAAVSLGDLRPWTASALVASVTVALAALLASVLAHHAWGSLRLALLMPLCLVFSGGLLYLDAFGDLAGSDDLWGYGQQVADRILSQQAFTPGYFHGNTTETFGVTLHSRATAFSMPIFLLFLFLTYRQSQKPQPTTALLIGMTLGALALAQETTFAIAAASFAIYRGGLLLFRWRGEGLAAIRREAAYDGLALAVGGSLAVLQGGVITDALIHGDSREVSSSISGFSLRRDIGFVSWAGFVSIGEDGWWQTVLKEFGLPLLLLPAYVVVAVRQPHPVTRLLLIISVMAFLIPLVIEYRNHDVELTRLFGLSQVSNGLLLAITLNHFLNLTGGRWFATAGAGALLALVAFSPLMFNLRAFPSSPHLYDPGVPAAEYVVAEGARELVPERARILTVTPDLVMTLWGQFAPYAESRDALYTPTEAWKRASKHPDQVLLRQMRIDYVYWNPAWEAQLSDGSLDLESLPYLTRVFEYTDGSGQEYVIYRVQDVAATATSGR